MKWLARIRRRFIRALFVAAASAAGAYFYDPRSGAERRRHVAAQYARWRTNIMSRLGLTVSPFDARPARDTTDGASIGVADRPVVAGAGWSTARVGLD